MRTGAEAELAGNSFGMLKRFKRRNSRRPQAWPSSSGAIVLNDETGTGAGAGAGPDAAGKQRC